MSWLHRALWEIAPSLHVSKGVEVGMTKLLVPLHGQRFQCSQVACGRVRILEASLLRRLGDV
jgi:hypothetical protein